MTSSNIQDYIFDNKEKIPDGIYKGIQDLLKKNMKMKNIMDYLKLSI